MMETADIWWISGLLIVTVVMLDMLWTTLWIDGAAGPVTNFITVIVWKFHRNTLGKINNKILSISGALLLFKVVASWITLIFIGWLLVFLSYDYSVIDSRTEAPSNFVDKIYFVAYSLFTLGNGDLKPAKGWWQIATPCITATGFFSITLAVTYILSVISAAVNKRNVAGKIASIGLTAQDFVINLWQSRSYNSIDLQLANFASHLNMLHEQHKAYPILHYFHTSECSKSTAFSISVLDDALSIFEYGITEDLKPSQSIINNVRVTITDFLETLNSTAIVKEKKTPPQISLNKLRKADIAVTTDVKFNQSIDVFASRRKQLLGMVEIDGWKWYSEQGK
jgi:hypothetical protein